MSHNYLYFWLLYRFGLINYRTYLTEQSKFIENKTSQQYVIVQKDFIKAISGQLFNNTVYIIDINKFINDSWVKLVQTNQATTDKWKEHLKYFSDKK